MSNKGEGKSSAIGFITDWVVPIVIAIVLALLIRQFVFFKVKIPSTSMVPTLNEGDQLIATRVYNLDNLKRGDIIVFNFTPEDKIYIKRLIGLPGDHIEIKNNVDVYVNGEKLEDSYVKNPDPYNENAPVLTYDVPDGKYFFLGDNRAVSFDSRRWDSKYGITYIDGSEIKGKAQIKVYPFSEFGSIK